MSQFRRKLLGGADSVIIPDYVQNGLIFELDGTDKQASGNYVWCDKVGNLKFTNTGNVIELPNGFHFDGTSYSILEGNSVVSPSEANNCTIEVVINSNVDYGKWGPIFVLNDWDSSRYYLGCNVSCSAAIGPSIQYVTYKSTLHLDAYKVLFNKLITVSLQFNSPIYINTILESTRTATNTGAFSSRGNAKIGGRVDGSNRVTFKGDIHAIRVYNRKLTLEEILYNQQIDILKYNIPF